MQRVCAKAKTGAEMAEDALIRVHSSCDAGQGKISVRVLLSECLSVPKPPFPHTTNATPATNA